MNTIAWLLVGVAIGLLASMLMKTKGRTDLWLNGAAGAAGALIGGYLFAPMITGAAVDPQAFGIATFVVSVFGAVVLLIIATMLRRAATQ